MQQLDTRDLPRGIDMWGVFFACSVDVCSSGYSFVLAVEFYKLLKLSPQGDEVLFFPEVIEGVQGVEGVEVCKDAHSVVGDLADETGNRPVVVSVLVCDAEELFPAVRQVQFPREGHEDELVGVAPSVEQSRCGESGYSFSKGVGRRELVQQEQGCR